MSNTNTLWMRVDLAPSNVVFVPILSFSLEEKYVYRRKMYPLESRRNQKRTTHSKAQQKILEAVASGHLSSRHLPKPWPEHRIYSGAPSQWNLMCATAHCPFQIAAHEYKDERISCYSPTGSHSAYLTGEQSQILSPPFTSQLSILTFALQISFSSLQCLLTSSPMS